MDAILQEFLQFFKVSFQPPVPKRGQKGRAWQVSGVWSAYMKKWLLLNYAVHHEYRVGTRRLDAALWSKANGVNQRNGKMDIALEWEWDNTKVASDFHKHKGDFQKCFEADAQCGLAIVHTRAHGNGGPTQADETVRSLMERCKEFRRDSRSVALIEIRRVLDEPERVEFLVCSQDLDTSSNQEIGRWCYPQ